MKHQTRLETLLGLFVVLTASALIFLSLRASHAVGSFQGKPLMIKAMFDDISGLHVHAPVSIAGVNVGEVTAIQLSSPSYQARVSLGLGSQVHCLPKDSSLAIMTEGLLGAKYISIEPGFSTSCLETGDTLEKTTSAFVLEKALGKFLFNRPASQPGASR